MSEPVWMVEVGQLCMGRCSKGRLKYVTFTDSDALKFKTKGEADQFGMAVAREHVFSAQSAQVSDDE